MSFFRPTPLVVEVQSQANGPALAKVVSAGRPVQHDSALQETSGTPKAPVRAGLDVDTQLNAVYSKVSSRLVPLFMLVVLANQIHRNNLAYAALTMNRDLRFSATTYGLGAALFFITFCVFQVPSNLVMVRVGVRRWLSFLVVGWGCIACLFALITNAASFYALRMLLGMFEAGATPAMWFHFSQFYPQSRLVKPYMYMTVGLLASNIIGAPLAAGFLALDGIGGLKGWQYLFILEGVPSVLLGVALFFVLPDSVQDAKWLTEKQKQILHDDMADSENCSPQRQHIPRSVPLLLKMAASNPLIAYLAAVGFMVSMAAYTFIFFLPIINNALLTGRSLSHMSTSAKAHTNSAHAVLLTCIPYVVSAVVSWLVAYHSQKKKELFIHITVCLTAGGVLMLLFPVLTQASVVAGLACVSLMAASVAAANGPSHALVARVSAGPSLVVGMPTFNSLASLGGFLGPFLTGYMLQNSDQGFKLVCLIFGSLLLLCAVMMFFLKYLLAAREKKHANLNQDWAAALPVKAEQSSAGTSEAEAVA